MSTNEILAERDVWKQRAEAAESTIKTLREYIITAKVTHPFKPEHIIPILDAALVKTQVKHES